MNAYRSAAGFAMNVEGITQQAMETQAGLDDVVGRVFAGVRAAASRIGEVKPFAVVLTPKSVVVVDYPPTLMADEAVPLWAERIRAIAKDLDASATLVVIAQDSSPGRWLRDLDEGGGGPSEGRGGEHERSETSR